MTAFVRPAGPGPRRAGRSTLCLLALCAGLAQAAPVTSGLGGRQPVAAQPADAAHERGLDALARGDLTAAEAAFRESLKLRPRHVPSLLGLGELAFARGRLDDAGRWIDQALQADPDDGPALATQGRLLALQGKRSEAESVLQRAIERSPRAVRPRMDLADLLASRGEHRRAIEIYRAVVALDAQHAGARYALGVSLRAVGEREAAIREFQAAIERAPQAALAHLELARTEMQQKRMAQAMQAVDRALALQPVPYDARLLKADLLDARGDADAALKTLAAAMAVAPRDPFPHLRSGMIEQQRGRLDEARRAYLRALELEARQPVALNNLAAIAVQRKTGLDEAEKWARDASAMNPRAAQFQHTLGEVLRARGKKAEAVAAFEAAARLAPRDATLVFHHGRALAEAGQGPRAKEVVRAALDLGADFAEADEARRLLSTL